MSETIQVLKPLYRTDEVLEEIRTCLEIGWTGMGFRTDEFEQKWAEYTGLPHAHFLTSATAGLHLALALFKMKEGWQDGDEVVTTALTFVSTNHVIMYERLTPVFADVDEYGCIDPAEFEALITDRTRAIIYVALGGNTGQLPRIAQICRERGVRLILDAAHLAGARLDGQDPGMVADVTVHSFQAVKNLPTADSGMISFADAELDALARQMTWLGIDKSTHQRSQGGTYRWRYDVPNVGYKYHGNSIMASMGIVALRYLDEDNARRRELAQHYEAAFAGDNAVRTVPVPEGLVHPRHIFQILVDDRDALIEAFYAASIYPGVHYISNADYEPYRPYARPLPRTDDFSRRVISLPLHLHLGEADLDRVVEVVRAHSGTDA
ncbi:MAG: DegT/DnrJ/EryC1/StrS family aminotransferase [Sphingomicrobium sp.]